MADWHRSLPRVVDRLQRLRVPVLILICLLGLSATVALAHHTWRTRQEVVALTFHRDVEDNLQRVAQAVDLSLEQVHNLATFIRSARRVDQREFTSFVMSGLRRYPMIHAVAWVPRIAAEDRAGFERSVSLAFGEPYVIREPTADSGLAPAGARDWYFPLTFAEPLGRMRPVLGVDLGSHPARQAAMRQAADEGRLVTTPPVPLMDGDAGRPAVVAFMPVYRSTDTEAAEVVGRGQERLVGFAAGAFLLEELFRTAVDGWKQPHLQMYLFDTSLEEGEQLLYARPGAASRALTVQQVVAASPLHASRQLVVGGRPWLLVTTPTPAYLAAGRTRDPWVVLLVGTALTGLTGLVLGGMIRWTDQMAAFAADREAANAALRERIREREEAEEALAQANAELRQINADMERFVGAVSHDLKSPLVAAEMMISVMKQAVAKQDVIKIGETSHQIGKACGRMRRIIDDLLEHQRAGFAGLRSGPVDLTEVALHVVEDHRELAMTKGVRIHLQEDMPTVRADRGRVTAVLDNLVGNALKYGSETDDPRVEIGAEVVNQEARLFVRDNGPGIAEEHRERLWELFQRLSRDEEGTGIGLAIVRRVAEAHGGRAWLECPPPPPGGPGGSVFWVAFPPDRVLRSEPRRPPETDAELPASQKADARSIG